MCHQDKFCDCCTYFKTVSSSDIPCDISCSEYLRCLLLISVSSIGNNKTAMAPVVQSSIRLIQDSSASKLHGFIQKQAWAFSPALNVAVQAFWWRICFIFRNELAWKFQFEQPDHVLSSCIIIILLYIDELLCLFHLLCYVLCLWYKSAELSPLGCCV